MSNHIALSQELIESVSEAELAKVKDKLLYSVGVNEESGHLEIHAMNNGHIVLHSVDEARFFTSLIMDHFRKA